ncbi:hypothetical protein MRX96_022933 [Rhipicephalus microplus]
MHHRPSPKGRFGADYTYLGNLSRQPHISTAGRVHSTLATSRQQRSRGTAIVVGTGIAAAGLFKIHRTSESSRPDMNPQQRLRTTLLTYVSRRGAPVRSAAVPFQLPLWKGSPVAWPEKERGANEVLFGLKSMVSKKLSVALTRSSELLELLDWLTDTSAELDKIRLQQVCSSLKKGKRTAGREGPSPWMHRGTTTADAALHPTHEEARTAAGPPKRRKSVRPRVHPSPLSSPHIERDAEEVERRSVKWARCSADEPFRTAVYGFRL